MKIEIDLEHHIIDNILITGLKEYYEYLITHPFQSGEYVEKQDDYETIVQAFEIVLQQYLSEKEYKLYLASLSH